MNKTLKWILIGLGIALVVFLVATAVFAMVFTHGSFRGGNFVNPMGRMMFPFGGLTMLFRFIVPLGVLALAVIGVVSLAKGDHGKKQDLAAPAATPVCKSCNKELHTGGEFCPFCGAKQ